MEDDPPVSWNQRCERFDHEGAMSLFDGVALVLWRRKSPKDGVLVVVQCDSGKGKLLAGGSGKFMI